MSTIVQDTVDLINPIGQEGAIAENFGPRKVLSRSASGPVQAGRMCFRAHGALRGQAGSPVGEPGRVYQEPSPIIGADVDAILATGGASATSVGLFDADEADGIVGVDDMLPGRRITLVLSSHTDWDASDATLRYVDQLTGLTVSETLVIPNGGNATVTSVGYARAFVSLSIPAQTGAGGTFTIGVAALDASLTAADMEGVAIRKPMSVMSDPDSDVDFADGETVGLLRKGSIFVVTEDACVEGDPVYCRVSGSGDVGDFRSDTDGGAAVLVPNARFGRSSAAAGLNVLELE